MWAWEFAAGEPTYRLQKTSRPDRTPKPNEVLIRMRACTLNYRDLVNWKKLAGRNVHGLIPLSDGTGDIIAVGNAVSRWKVGDRVAGCFFPDWESGPFQMAYHKTALGGGGDGMLSEMVVLPETAVVRIPDHLSYVEGATLPCAAVTAWQALITRGHLKPGDTVLVLGTGGVSIFGLQIASAWGARVLVTSSSNEKLARARQLGADVTINYREQPAWEEQVLELTDGNGVDHILEVGGPGTLEKSLKALCPGGHLALIGVLTGFGPPTSSLFPLMSKNGCLDGIYVGSRRDFEQLNKHLSGNQTVPVVDRMFSLEEIPAAFSYLESGQHFGKVAIRFDD